MSTPNQKSDSREERLRAAQLRMLYGSVPIALVITLVAAVLLVAALWPVVDHGTAAIWSAAMLVVVVLRGFNYFMYRKHPPGPSDLDRAWHHFYFGIMATGLVWGSVSIVLFPSSQPVYQAFIGLVLTGLSAGAVTALSVSRKVALAFLLPTLVPLAIRFLASESRIGILLGLMTVLFFVFVVFNSLKIGKTLKDNQLLRLEVEDRGALLAESMAELTAVFDSVNQFLVLLDTHGRIVRCNRTAQMWLGQQKQLEGAFLCESERWPETDRARLAEEIELAGQAQCVRREQTIKSSSGREVTLDFSLSPVLSPSNETLMIVAAASDITKRIKAERIRESSERKFRSLVEQSLVGVYIVEGGLFTYVNPTFVEIFGYRSDEIEHKLTVRDLVYEPDRDLVEQNVNKRAAGELEGVRYQFRGLRKDNKVIDVEVLGTPTEINGRRVIVGTLLDVTGHKADQKRIEELANFDELTGLPNRRLLMDAARDAVATSRTRDEPLCVMYLDLDRFKNVNDTLGHDAGDQLLIDVSNRLRACLRGSDFLARLGGDEFAFVLPGASTAIAEKVAQRVVRTVGEPFHVAGQNVRVSGSVGIASLSDAEGDATSLFKQADIAMYRAKRERGGYAFFRQGEEQVVQTRLALETELANAIDHGGLHLVYQPRVDLNTGLCDSVEALVRWDHPRRGTISPAEFIPIAEETGLVIQLGTWVMHEAFAQLRRWIDTGLELRMGINVSLREIHDAQLIDRLRRALEEHRIESRWVELEITESAAMTDPVESIKTLRRLHDMGVALSIDDFGTGYSSLNHLKRMPASFLKIDQSFVGGIGMDTAEGVIDEGIIRVITALAKSLGIEVIAEGVEQKEQLEFLLAEGCRFAQGYYFARPMPPDQLHELLSGRPRLLAQAAR